MMTKKSLNKSDRKGGILLHPSSLPGRFGIGDLGPELYKFIDILNEYRQNLWQILPLGPTGYGNSPYQCFSAFAGNPLIISPDWLYEIGLLSKNEIKPQESFSESCVEYGKVILYKWQLLERAYKNFLKKQFSKLEVEFIEFKNNHSYWLDDFSLFMSIKKAHEFRAWNEWDNDLKFRNGFALERWKKNHQSEIEFQMFVQFIFFKQWNEVKKYANLKDIKIIGDIPIFVAYDSVDVWAHPEYYYLNDERELLYVAGVPPDYFSQTGQRWGNPLYNWDLLKELDYRWWIQRIKHNFNQVDILRIDHFRGFESYWRIKSSEKTAIKGKWVSGPGLDLFLAMDDELGTLPIIAEDLGIITPEVESLLEEIRFPGMRVLQFAFMDVEKDTIKNNDLPHNFQRNTIVYTGTHDNQTTKAWFEDASDEIKQFVLDYTNSDGKDIVGDLIRLAWSSVAEMAVIPLQDLLRLGDSARMNYPGRLGNNWEWRFTWDQVSKERFKEILKYSTLYERD
ncbi:MAG: 4-alpha-glucanotransferase [Candidatus Thorarchaeota archaeon]